MKAPLVLTFTLLISGLLFSQPVPIWSSSISSNFSWYIYDKPILKFDNLGDIILVGNISGTSNKDMLVVKYSPSGNILWQRTYNNVYDNDDIAIDFDIDKMNNILIIGKTVTDSSKSDGILVKYNTSGDLMWQNTYNGVARKDDAFNAISLTSEGTSLITGFSSTDTLNHQKLLITKIDSSGNTIWTTTYSTDSLASFNGEKIKVSNNSIKVLGSMYRNGPSQVKFLLLRLDTNGTITFSNETITDRPGSCFYQDNIGNAYIGYGVWERFKISKIDSSGNLLWSDTYVSELPLSVSGDEVRAIVVDSIQNIYVTGRHYGEVAQTNADILTLKYTPTGTRIWTKRYTYLSNNAADIPNDIILDKNLNVYVAGQSERTIAGADYDYIVVKYDNTGSEIGTIRFNNASNGDDAITSLIVSDDSSIYVTGLSFPNTLSSTTTQKYNSFVAVGIQDLNANNKNIRTFPNPFSSTTEISFENIEKSVYSFELFDISGRVLLREKTTSSKIDIQGNTYNDGMYFFNLTNGQNIYTGKILKSKN